MMISELSTSRIPCARRSWVALQLLLVMSLFSARICSAVQDSLGRAEQTHGEAPIERLSPRDPSTPSVRVHTADIRLRGVNSCAAASCHGGGRVQEGPGFAASQIWSRSDPHARAWDVLTGDAARSIMERLTPKPEGATVRATEDSRCLNCHVTTESPLPAGAAPAVLMHRDGVGCESCHGPARDWIAIHATPPWKTMTVVEKAALGFPNTAGNLVERARLCFTCHVGSAGRNLSHDLLAAGHPRLDFEFSTFYANLPRHWETPSRKPESQGNSEQRPDFEVQAWYTGQLVAATAAVELLKVRTQPEHTWPEFSEQSCFNCHHDLEDRNWYQLRRQSQGTPVWGAWTPGVYPALAEDDASVRLLKSLTQTMQRPVPDRQQASHLAEQLIPLLAKQLTQVEMKVWSGSDLDPFMLQLIRHCRLQHPGRGSLPAANWDEAAQLYLGLRAAEMSRRRLLPNDPASAQLQNHLESIRKGLLFPPGKQSPGSSVVNLPDTLNHHLMEIEQILSRPSMTPARGISPIIDLNNRAGFELQRDGAP